MPDASAATSDAIAFPVLDASDLASLRPLATSCFFEDGQTVFRVGDADLDLFVVEAGAIEIVNPSDDNRHIVTHGPGRFLGELNFLTGQRAYLSARMSVSFTGRAAERMWMSGWLAVGGMISRLSSRS